jgi:hypothetical protein
MKDLIFQLKEKYPNDFFEFKIFFTNKFYEDNACRIIESYGLYFKGKLLLFDTLKELKDCVDKLTGKHILFRRF